MKWLWRSLPGSRSVRILLAAVIVVAGLFALHFIYEWMGATLVDSGGSIG